MRKTRQLILDLSDLALPALGCLIVCIGGFSGPHAGKLLPERLNALRDLTALLLALFKLSCLRTRIFIIYADQANF